MLMYDPKIVPGNSAVMCAREGKITLDNLQEFENSMNLQYEAGRNILLDLSGVTYLDSSALGIIILFISKLEKKDRKLVLFGVRDSISEMFSIAGVTRLVTLARDEDEALQALTP